MHYSYRKLWEILTYESVQIALSREIPFSARNSLQRNDGAVSEMNDFKQVGMSRRLGNGLRKRHHTPVLLRPRKTVHSEIGTRHTSTRPRRAESAAIRGKTVTAAPVRATRNIGISTQMVTINTCASKTLINVNRSKLKLTLAVCINGAGACRQYHSEQYLTI